MGELSRKNWKEIDLNVDSLWIFPERQKGGKHTNSYHGNFIPQIPNQLIRRYTEEGDTILELFSGSGTTLFECETLNRKYIGFDINKEINSEVEKKMKDSSFNGFQIFNCDVTNRDSFNNCLMKAFQKISISNVDFLIAHPPYLNIIKFSDDKRDLSNFSNVNSFIDKLLLSIENGIKFLANGKYFAIVCGDVYKNREVIPLAFNVMEAIRSHFNVKLKGIVIKNIEGNRGKLGKQDIWRFRAIQSDYFIFKHEYIFVFKKII